MTLNSPFSRAIKKETAKFSQRFFHEQLNHRSKKPQCIVIPNKVPFVKTH